MRQKRSLELVTSSISLLPLLKLIACQSWALKSLNNPASIQEKCISKIQHPTIHSKRKSTYRTAPTGMIMEPNLMRGIASTGISHWTGKLSLPISTGSKPSQVFKRLLTSFLTTLNTSRRQLVQNLRRNSPSIQDQLLNGVAIAPIFGLQFMPWTVFLQ